MASAARRYQDAQALRGVYVSTSAAVRHAVSIGASFAEAPVEFEQSNAVGDAVAVAMSKAPVGGYPNADAAVRAAALEYQKSLGSKVSLSDATKAVLAWMLVALSQEALGKTEAPAFAEAAALKFRDAAARATPAALHRLVSILRTHQQSRTV